MGGSGFVEGNLFDIYNRPQGPPRSFQPEQVDILSEQLDDHGRIIHRIERIVSTGQVTPEDTWYDQDTDEFVSLLQGEARILFYDGQETSIRSGEYLTIPAHVKHRVSFTSADPPCVWLVVHTHPHVTVVDLAPSEEASDEKPSSMETE